MWYEVLEPNMFTVAFLDKSGNYQNGNLKAFLDKGVSFSEIEEGLQRIVAGMDVPVVFVDQKEEGKQYLPETDTFDTWFSSGQWPYVTLQTAKPGDFEKFYPTSVMETAYDILRAWVSRMIMLGLYRTDEVPFRHVLFHGIVNDPLGKKMSKSKGNVIDPLELVDQYGADAVRFALVYGNATGSDQALSYPNLDAARRFTNKLWNIGRFILDFKPEDSAEKISKHEDDVKILDELGNTAKLVTKALNTYDFHFATAELYRFIWHEFADKYVEKTKDRRAEAQPCLEYVYLQSLKLLHPFMPFVTEEIYQKMPGHGASIMIDKWPSTLDIINASK